MCVHLAAPPPSRSPASIAAANRAMLLDDGAVEPLTELFVAGRGFLLQTPKIG
jgi:hypothetical protein